MIGELARQDDLPDVGDPLISSGAQFSPGVPAVNNFFGQLLAPRQRDENSSVEYRTASPLVNITRQDIADATEAAMGVSGGGLATRDPKLWHGLSEVRLPRPLAEMKPNYAMGDLAATEKVLTPADMQGGWLLPGLGDRTLAGGKLTGLEGKAFDAPVELQGGHGFMPANVDTGAAWASDPGVITRLANKTRELAKSGEVYFPYTAMGERSADFSHHVSDTLSQMLRQNGVPKAAATAFDEKMLVPFGKDYPAVANWPGVNSPELDAYLRSQSGVVRNKFAKVMDTRSMQDIGMPSVAEARYAVTDPRLLNVPTGASGLSIARLDPSGQVMGQVAQPHQTYGAQLGGKYIGGLGASVPKEVLFPDMIKAYAKLGYEPFRYDYLMARGVSGAPIAQRANQRWVDRVSKYLERER